MAKFLVKIAHNKGGKGNGWVIRDYRIESNSESSAKNEALSRCRKDSPSHDTFEIRSIEAV